MLNEVDDRIFDTRKIVEDQINKVINIDLVNQDRE